MHCDPSLQPPLITARRPRGYQPLASSPITWRSRRKRKKVPSYDNCDRKATCRAAALIQPCLVGTLDQSTENISAPLMVYHSGGWNPRATDQPLIATRYNARDVTVRCKDKHARLRHVHVIGPTRMNALDRVLTSFRGVMINEDRRAPPNSLIPLTSHLSLTMDRIE